MQAESIEQVYYWFKIQHDVKIYVWNCVVCQQIKKINKKTLEEYNKRVYYRRV